MQAQSRGAPPILIVGVLQRSGTNYLSRLVRLHPACAGPPAIFEDFVLEHAHLLGSYADATVRRWDPAWGVDRDAARRDMLERFGQALTNLLAGDAWPPERRLVTKTPWAVGVELSRDLFPDSPVVLLVRDGRDTVASGIRGFGWTLEGGARAWATGARRLLDAIEGDRDGRFHLVRYEDLVEDPSAALTAVLRHCGLDPDDVDMGAVDAVPVVGSSYDTRGLHWDGAPPATLQASDRAREWSSDAQRRFDRLAGVELARFGYERDPVGPPTLGERVEAALRRLRPLRPARPRR